MKRQLFASPSSILRVTRTAFVLSVTIAVTESCVAVEPLPTVIPIRLAQLAPADQSPPLTVPPAAAGDESPKADATSDASKTVPLAAPLTSPKESQPKAEATKTAPIEPDDKKSETKELRIERMTVIVPRPRRKTLKSIYDSIYRSIPYRRSEYRANPGYRHQATVEIMISRQLFPSGSAPANSSTPPKTDD